MLRTIRVYGALARFLKRKVFRAQVANAAEAVRFLLANFPQVEKHMADQYYEVRVGSRALQLGKDPGELHLPTGQREVISIIPVIAGAGGGVSKILIGIGLIAAAIVLGPAVGGFLGLGAGLAASGAGAGIIGGVAAGAIGAIGASLVLGGVAQLITPTPKLNLGFSSGGGGGGGGNNVVSQDGETDPRRSYSFSGVQNVSRQGVPVPVVYGEVIVGSIVISSGISTEKVTA
jgi:predicted phage tail protein